MLKKIIVLLSCLFLLIFAQQVSLAQEVQEEVLLKNALKQLHLMDNFQGEIITRVYVQDTVLTYRTGLLKDGGRADVSNLHTFWQLKGTDVGRQIRSIPWLYLPPDYSLVQYALPIERSSTLLEPLRRIGEDYEVKLVDRSADEVLAIFELNNGFVIQRITMDQSRDIITKIQIFNAARKEMATIEYAHWKELYSGVLLPENVKIFGPGGHLLAEMIYLNWKVNQGVSGFASTLSDSWNKAVENLKDKILDKPDNDEYHYELAQLYQQEEFWSNALEELNKAYALNPKMEYREDMAQVYFQLGQYQEAIHQMEIVLNKKESGQGYFFLGNLYQEINNPMLAREAYEKAVALDDDVFIYWERLFWNYRNISIDDARMLKRAIQVCEKLIDMKPDGYQYHIYMGDLYLQNNEANQALEQYEKAQELKPDESLPWVKLAQYYESVGEVLKAEAAFIDATRVKEHWWNYLQLGDFYLRQAKIEEAMSAYEQSLQMNPRNTDLTIKLGKILWQMGQIQEAKDYWYQVLQYEEANIYTYIKVGEILKEYNLHQEAEEVFMKAVERFQLMGDRGMLPGLSRIYEEMGLAYLEKDPEIALDSFEKAYEFQPSSVAGEYLGLRELKKGNLAEAIRFWTEANLLDGDNYQPYIYLTVVKGLKGRMVRNQNQEIGHLNQVLNLQERELLGKFFNYFNHIRDLIDEDETTVEIAKQAYLDGLEYFQKGDLNQAVSKLQKAVDLDQHYKKGLFFLGVTLSLLDRPLEAQKYFKMVQADYAGSTTSRMAADLNQMIQKLFWKIPV